MNLIVVSNKADWTQEVTGATVVDVTSYLTDERWSSVRRARVYNLCRRYNYQSAGYYVSLLAAARGHKPFPSVMTLLEMRNTAVVRTIGEELNELIQKSLAHITSKEFVLSVYFGRNLSKQYDRLCARLREQFPAPLLRAKFVHDGEWNLFSISPIATKDVPPSHLPFLIQSAAAYFDRPSNTERRTRKARFRMAILHDPDERLAPSDPKSLKRFIEAADRVDIDAELVRRADYSRVAEFDALFIRETTAINHHTFRFAQRALAEGLVVIDDPQSILRCSNKVFFAEAMKRAGVPTPKTLIADRIDAANVAREIGFPCVVKHPDGAFSKGVHRCDDAEQYERSAKAILSESDLLVAQPFVPSEFDWRVGVLAGQALFACRYHMARGHWQIAKHGADGTVEYGKVDTIPLDQVPSVVLNMATRAAAAMGRGLYGVDLKQFGDSVLAIEVNDNPNLNAGFEDAVLERSLYDRIVGYFLTQLEANPKLP